MKVTFKVDTPRFLSEAPVVGIRSSGDGMKLGKFASVDGAWPIEPVMRFSQWIAQHILGHAARGIAGLVAATALSVVEHRLLKQRR